MNPEITAWAEQAKRDVHYHGKTHSVWQDRFLEVYKELERANKIINRLID